MLAVGGDVGDCNDSIFVGNLGMFFDVASLKTAHARILCMGGAVRRRERTWLWAKRGCSWDFLSLVSKS